MVVFKCRSAFWYGSSFLLDLTLPVMSLFNNKPPITCGWKRVPEEELFLITTVTSICHLICLNPELTLTRVVCLNKNTVIRILLQYNWDLKSKRKLIYPHAVVFLCFEQASNDLYFK